MPTPIEPQDQWETEFEGPLPGEPGIASAFRTLIQRVLNRTEWLWARLFAHRSAPILDHPNESVTSEKIADGAVTIPKLANASVNPTPNTLPVRNAQGALQDGATRGLSKVVKLAGIYDWSTGSRWVRIAQWTLSPTGYDFRGVFADLHFTQLSTLGLGSRVRVRAHTNASGAFVNPAISISQDYLGGNVSSGIITNAALVQVAPYVVELWVYSPTRVVYVQGTVLTNAESVTIPPYGTISDQASPPSPISGGLYLEWNLATVGQTFAGPGNIVAASHTATQGYVRYDNGIQIAWATITVGIGTWTYPAAFASTPQVLATAQDTVLRLVAITSVSTTAAGVVRTDLFGDIKSGTVHLWAIGLWK